MEIKITTKSHLGGIVRTWTATEAEYVIYASEECADKDIELAGYDDHRGDYDHAEYPKFNDEDEQISGARVATFDDAVAWFGHDVQSIKIEEIGEN